MSFGTAATSSATPALSEPRARKDGLRCAPTGASSRKILLKAIIEVAVTHYWFGRNAKNKFLSKTRKSPVQISLIDQDLKPSTSDQFRLEFARLVLKSGLNIGDFSTEIRLCWYEHNKKPAASKVGRRLESAVLA